MEKLAEVTRIDSLFHVSAAAIPVFRDVSVVCRDCSTGLAVCLKVVEPTNKYCCRVSAIARQLEPRVLYTEEKYI